MMQIYLQLPWAIAYGSYYTQTRWGKHLSVKGKKFKDAVAVECQEQNVFGARIDKPVELSVIFYPPDRRIRDLDNHLKSLQDALTEAQVWEDDSLVDQGHQYRGNVCKGGRVLVRIREAGPLMPLNSDGVDPWALI